MESHEFKAFWDHVREINILFKNLRSIGQDERQRLWSELGKLCDRAKATRDTPRQSTRSRGDNESSARASYETRVIICRKLDNVRLAQHATTWDQVKSAKDELYECLEMMKSDWAPRGMFVTAGRLNREDHEYCFDAWRMSKGVVDNAFARLKVVSQGNTSDFIDRCLTKISRKRDLISRLEDQIRDLEGRISNSTSSGYISDAEGWIREKRSIIDDAERDIDELTDRVDDARRRY